MNQPILVKPLKDLDNGSLDQIIEDLMDDLQDAFPGVTHVCVVAGKVKEILAIKASRKSNQEVCDRKD